MNSAAAIIRKPTSGRQRGSVLIQAAAVLLVLVIALTGTEIGYLFYLKRELQKTADLAALAGANALVVGNCSTASSAAIANANKNQQSLGFVPTVVPSCGSWDTTNRFNTAGSKLTAMKVIVSGTGPTLLPLYRGSRLVAAEAVAAARTPLAALTIRSTLLTVDTSKSALLNSLFSGLLGGSLNVSAVGWEGLINSDVKLFSYLDQLALNLGLAAGRYDQVLATSLSVGNALQAVIQVLQRDGGTAQASLDALGALATLQSAIPGSAPLVKLADLIQLQSGTDYSGANLSLQAFQIAEALVQLANKNSGVTASVPLTVPGVGTVTTRVKVIEPAQISAVGDPELARLNPLGPNKIYVRTAQIRTLISVDLNSSLTSLVGTLATTVSDLVSPITSLLNSLLSLNLVDLLSNLLCLGCTRDVTDIQILPSPFRLDVNLDVASGNAYVTNYSCGAAGDKSLTVPAVTSALNVRIGKMGTSASDAATKVFASSSAPTVDPIALIDIGAKSCTTVAVLGIIISKNCAARRPFVGGGIGLKTDAAIAQSARTMGYATPAATNLPELPEAPAYQSVSASNAVSSLSTTLSQVDIRMYKPAVSGSGLGDLLSGVGSTINALIPLLQQAISTVLSPLLDPVVNSLLKSLGIDIANSEVGARMTCNGQARLVY